MLFTDNELDEIHEILEKYKGLDSYIKQCELIIEKIKNEKETIGAIRYDKDRLSQSYNISNQIEDNYIRKEEKIEKYENIIKKTKITKNMIEIAINNLTSNQRILFDYKYNNAEDLKEYEIANNMNMCEDMYRKTRKEMLLSIANSLYPERTLEWLNDRFLNIGKKSGK